MVINTNKKIILAIIIVLVIIGEFIISRNFKDNNSYFVIKVADPRAIGGAIFHVALEKHYFDDFGLKIEVNPVQTGDEVMKALMSKSVDVGLSGTVPYAFSVLENQEIKIIAMTAYINDNQIIVNTSKDIHSAEDLKGKNIGYAKTTVSEAGLDKFLNAHNISKTDVHLINIKPLLMPAALASGQIDAYSAWEPHILNGKKLLGDRAYVFDSDEDVYTWQQAIFAQDSYIKSHVEELKKFVAALQKAELFIKTNKEESIRLSALHNNVPVDTLTDIWSRYDFGMAFRDDLPKILKENLEWANSTRGTKLGSIPSADNLIDKSILYGGQK